MPNKKNIISRLLPALVITIYSFLPVIYTWNRAVIGGDTSIPFSSQAITKYLYQWIGIQNGSYFTINFYPLYFFYRTVEFFDLSFYQTSSLLLFLLNLIAGLGVYHLAKLFYKGSRPYHFLIPITFYLLSPALLNGWHYLYIYSFSPWFLYFIFKAIKNHDFKWLDIFWLNFTLFFAALDLPNPKYIFYLLLMAFVSITASFLVRLIDLKFLIKTIGALAVSLCLSAYLIFPLTNFVFNYSPVAYGVTVSPGYRDGGNMMDFGSATMDKMVNLHHFGLNLNQDDRQKYLANPIVTVLGYFYFVLILFDIVMISLRSQRSTVQTQKLVLLSLIGTFLLLAVGPNPPFGFIYEFLVTHFNFLAFLRTTAGAVFFLSLFYSLYLFIFIQEQKKYSDVIFTLLIIVILITGYPLLLGSFYENNTNLNRFALPNQRGFQIPDDYFKIATFLNNQKLDTKVYFPGIDSSYLNTKWGYFGPLFYSFAYKNTPVSEKMLIYGPAFHNLGMTFLDKSAISDVHVKSFPQGQAAFNGETVELYQTPLDQFLPHFYVPQIILSTPHWLGPTARLSFNLTKNSRIAYRLATNSSPAEMVSEPPILEYKKINPTKYRLIIHHAKQNFPLVFQEAFNDAWQVYRTNWTMSTVQEPFQFDTQNLNAYQVYVDNAYFQATKKELNDLVLQGFVTSLGSTGQIDFVSKSIQGVIQNDNLPDGSFYENWYRKSLSSVQHEIVNGYANSWTINPQAVCQQLEACKQNPDGSFDFELVVEFWPQRLFYFGLILTGSTLLFGFGAWFLIGRKKDGNV